MKSVSSNLKTSQKKPWAFEVKKVYYKKRYWVPLTATYRWDTSWLEVPSNEILNISQITQQFDSERMNEFRLSNVGITLKNLNGKWSPGNDSGIFGRSRTATHFSLLPYYGSTPYWTKFQIRGGWVKDDGTNEEVTLFTGLATSFQRSANSDTVTVNVEGLENILKNTSAEGVFSTGSQNFTGTGAQTVFNITQFGIKKIKSVFFAGPVVGLQVEGTNYTVSNLNSPDVGATITFAVAPVNTQVIQVQYENWKANQKVETLVTDLLNAAGITSYVVSPVLFPSGLSALLSNDAQADWNAGTLGPFDTVRVPGDLYYDPGQSANSALESDFSSGLSGWTTLGGGVNPTVSGGQLVMDTGGIFKASDKRVGAWKFDVKQAPAVPPGALSRTEIGFMCTGVNWDGVGVNFQNGYVLTYEITPGFPSFLNRFQIGLYRQTSRTSRLVIAGYGDNVTGTAMKQIIVTRDHAGRIKVWFDGVLVIDVTDTTYNTPGVFGIGGGTSLNVLDNVYFPTTAAVGQFISRVMDAGATVAGWGRFLTESSLGGATANFQTRVSTDAISWDAYLDVLFGNTIQSLIKRYIQFKLDLTIGDIQNTDPRIGYVNIEYTTQVTTLRLANFTGKTVYDSIQSLAKFCNYEWGFSGDEVFFFRAKKDTPDVQETFDWTVNATEITQVDDGFDRIYSGVKVTYGSKIVEANEGAGDFQSIAKTYGSRQFEVDGGDLLTNYDTVVATGVAAVFFKTVTKLKKRVQIRVKMMEWVELGDIIRVRWNDALMSPAWYHGDQTVYVGMQDIYHFGSAMMTVDDFVGRVISARQDIESRVSDFELEEVS